MTRIQHLEQLVSNLYKARFPKRADWADWLSENHVFIVADNASRLARKRGANEELARAAALLHDIADTVMNRFADEHETVSLEMARELMQRVGFTEDEIRLTVDDAIRLHSCYDGNAPESIEGKVLSSADAQAHLLTDFYIYAAWSFGKDGKSFEDVKKYIGKKTRRDFHNKIQFDEVQHACKDAYMFLQSLAAPKNASERSN